MNFNFRSRIQNKLLQYLFFNENKSVYVNELARIIEEDPKNVYRFLRRLEDQGILVSEFRGKERYYSINKQNPLTKSYKDLFVRTSGLERLLKDILRPIEGLQQAYIFGSFANQTFESMSDIDLLLIGDHDRLTVQERIVDVQKKIGREVNVVNLTDDEFKQRQKKKDQFLSGVFSRKLIKLI